MSHLSHDEILKPLLKWKNRKRGKQGRVCGLIRIRLHRGTIENKKGFVLKKFMTCMKGVAVLSSLAVVGYLGHLSDEADPWFLPWCFFPLLLINLWTVLKKKPGKMLKILAVLVSLFVFYMVWVEFCWPWGHHTSRRMMTWRPGDSSFHFHEESFFCALGCTLLLICNLIAVLRPKLPKFLVQSKEKSPHIIAAYSFATALCILLVILIVVIALK